MSRFPVFDSHVDTLLRISGPEDFLTGSDAQLDEPRALRGGVEDLVMAICAEAERDPLDSWKRAYDLFGKLEGRSALRLHLMAEGCQPLVDLSGGDLPQGLRVASLTWNPANSLAGGVLSDRGMSEKGRRFVRRLREADVMLDVSHLCDRSRRDLLSMDVPVVATHCNCRKLCDGPRNLPDDDIKRIASLGGVVGITFVPKFLADGATLSDVVDHASHVADLVGVDHVGFGSDFDGMGPPPVGVKDCTSWPSIFEEMSKRGWRDREILKASCLNWRRLFGLEEP
jgi:microsomal dipeptidase-like Zn-dependent dipeptidase